MQGYVRRFAEKKIKSALKRSPAVAILGPGQCGKSTVASEVLKGRDAVYLDLQDRQDLNKLNEPELFFDKYRNSLICLDEIQRLPSFFSALRSEIDRDRRPGRFLILGSASLDLLRQSNESLAGRIAFIDLTPFLSFEVQNIPWQDHLLRGGFPDSLLSNSDDDSYDWRTDFVRTFLERDIPAFGFYIPVPVMERLWRLMAHYHGQTLNYSKMADSSELSIPTLKKYLRLLEQTYMVRLLPVFEANLKKRLVKSPKIYLRDSGILHYLLGIERYDQLLSNSQNGASFEGYAIEIITAALPGHQASFIRTSGGAEVDLVMKRGNEIFLFEFKLSKAPKASRGFYEIVKDLSPAHAWLVAPVDESYQIKKGVTVTPLRQLPFISDINI